MDQFKSFKIFISKIDHYGMKSGIVKVIPPKEWYNTLAVDGSPRKYADKSLGVRNCRTWTNESRQSRSRTPLHKSSMGPTELIHRRTLRNSAHTIYLNGKQSVKRATTSHLHDAESEGAIRKRLHEEELLER